MEYANVHENQDQRQTSEELQLLGNLFEHRLDWIGGIYNFEESGHEDLFGSDTSVFDQNVTVSSAYDARNTSKAVYGNLIFSVTDDWRINGGLRYTKDSKSIDSYPRYTQTLGCILTLHSRAHYLNDTQRALSVRQYPA